MARSFSKIGEIFAQLRPARRSLKTTLAIYFIPISVLPAIFISVYATRLLENSTRESLIQKARSEGNLIANEINNFEKNLLNEAKSHAEDMALRAAIRNRDKVAIERALGSFSRNLQVRVYTENGKFLSMRDLGDKQIPYISRGGMANLRSKGMTLNRYFSSQGLIFLIRVLISDRGRLFGILEEQYVYSDSDLAELKSRRQVDLMLLNRDMKAIAASLALSKESIELISKTAYVDSFLLLNELNIVELGDNRFATFRYVLKDFSEQGKPGYLAVFLPLAASDAIINKLKIAMIYMTAILILIAAFLIFVFSKRIVRPIEKLVLAMKLTKAGKAEQIPEVDANHEIEYLVHSFNEMSKSISAAKRTLEIKLEELKIANQEIKQTQGHLIQSAKMISLGQLVAGVAHELNNPIAFIYSNMLHLTEYVDKICNVIERYRNLQDFLPVKERERMRSLERDLEIDYIIEDMVELTKSCVDGANRVKEIVLGLRTFSRIEDSVFRKVDLHESLRNTVKLLVTEFKDRVIIHEEFGGIPMVECNLSQMNQVFMNIISNAAQAIQDQGDIWIRSYVEGEHVFIEIEDNGCGIPPDILEKIFDPFFTTKKIGKGTGLGLSIAYGLIQKHNGKIEVDSQMGKGTCFIIQVPVEQNVSAAIA